MLFTKGIRGITLFFGNCLQLSFSVFSTYSENWVMNMQVTAYISKQYHPKAFVVNTSMKPIQTKLSKRNSHILYTNLKLLWDKRLVHTSITLETRCVIMIVE